jgi:hypothetical protein
MAVGTRRLSFEAGAAAVPRAVTVYRAVLWSLLASKVVGGWGVQWDIQWHVVVGRDSFWIPPHVMTYAGVGLMVVLSFGTLAWDTFRLRGAPAEPGTIRLLGLTGPRGFHLAAWGIALTVLAAPIDDLWHRLFGLDVTIWSPPHLLGILGSVVNSLACLLIAREAYPARRWARFAAIILGGGLLYGNLHLSVQPSNLVAYAQGGVLFHTLAILSALLLPTTLVATARAADSRWAPVLLLVVIIVIGMAGHRIAQIGFEWLQPVSVIDAEIVKDPTSPVALANIIARKAGSPPGRTGGRFHLVSLVPVLAMALVDPRRRPVSATLAYAIALFGSSAWMLSQSVVFGPLFPTPLQTSTAFALTLIAAIIGGVFARWVATSLIPER